MLPVNSLKLKNHLPPRKNRTVSFALGVDGHLRCSQDVDYTGGAVPALMSPTPEVQHLHSCLPHQRCST